MPAGFKIAEAYVAVVPKDQNFQASLRELVDMASEDINAQVGVDLHKDAPEDLRADLDAALHLATDGLTADVGLGLKNDAVGELDADVKAGVQLVQDNNKIKVKVDPQAAQAAGKQGGSLIMAAIAAGAVFGPAAILTGFDTALAGIAVMVAKSNADVQAEYKTLASDIGRTLTDAVQPVVPAVQTAMVQADTSIRNLGPTLKKTFSDAAPDIVTAESGIIGLATHALPGLDTAINNSRGIFSGFFGELPQLGSGAGQFFTGLTTNAQSTEKGIVDLVDVLSHALGTVGQVAGSASAALSTDFDAITPALNGTLTVIQKLANPATVGGLIGVFGAMKLDPAISRGLQSASNGLVTVAAKADGASGLLGKAGTAAEKAAGGLGTMADVMGGPWGLAIGAGIGLLGGWVSSMNQTIATASDFSAAVAQDNGVVGANTAAIIQQKLASVDLSSVQKDLGVSQATLIEYASGEKDAQTEVTKAYNGKIAALSKTAGVTQEVGKGVVTMNNASQQEINTLARAKNQVDQVTSAVAQAIKQQNEQNKAYLAATQSAGIFAGMVDTATTALQTQAQQQAIGAVASLQLGNGQAALGQQLSNILYNYQLTTDAAQGYQTVMNALDSATSNLDDAQNTLAQDMLNAQTSFKANKYSLDLSTQGGINNRQALSAASKAIIQLGVDQINAGGSIDKANQTIQHQIDAFVKATGATGKQKDAIIAYLQQITKIPPNVATNVNANTSPARQALAHLLNDINASAGTIQIKATNGLPGGKALGANADGGGVQAGDYSLVGERGPEIVQFGRAGTVIPNEAIRKVSGDSTLAKASGVGGVTIHSLTIPITGIVDLTDPNSMTASARRMVIQLNNALVQVRNGRTGAIY